MAAHRTGPPGRLDLCVGRMTAGKSRSSDNSTLVVRPVETADDREAFIKLPWCVQGNDPNWVPPLLMERREHLNPKKNPLFDMAEVRLWLAYRGSRCVGRISAQINRAHLERYQDSTGHFGMIEAEDNSETFAALCDAALTWLRDQGMKRVLGPFNLSINEESGLLVKGYDRPPSLMMGHSPPYYAKQLEAQGFTKAKDLICYDYDTTKALPRSLTALVEKATREENLVIRPLNLRRFDEELAQVIDVFNDAWSDNWSFLPFTQADIRHMAKSLRPLIRSKSGVIAERNGEAVAMCIALPNINEAIADLNGELLPFGWLKLLWRLKVSGIKSGRMPLMGVRRRYHGTPLGAALACAVIDVVRANQIEFGVTRGELSWVLEDNYGVDRIIRKWGGDPYKTYRVYEKALV